MTLYIHEVYYDNYGNITFYSKSPIPTWGDDENELMESLSMQMAAINKSILNLDVVDRTLKNKNKKNQENNK
jgi:hypothetical protein